MKMLLKYTQPVQSHVQRDLWLAIIGMETKGRDLDRVENVLADTSDCSKESEEDRLQTHKEERDDTPVNKPENEPEEEVSVDNQSTAGVDSLNQKDQVESQKAADSWKRSGRYSLRERVHLRQDCSDLARVELL